MSIPPIISRIWLGPKPIPPESERFWERFKELHPGWELRTWTDGDDYSWLRNRELFERASTFTARSDVLRFEILERGGIYVDVDVEPLRSLAPLLAHPAFAGWEDQHSICGAVMGAEPHHPAITALIDALPGWIAEHPDATPSVWAGPVFLTAQWAEREDVKLLPTTAFYPIHWKHRGRTNGHYPGSYTVHHWSRNWNLVDEPKLSILMAWTDKGDAYRNRVKDWVEGYWRAKLPEAEFIIGTDGGREPFNRAACFNDAASRATGNVFFCTDADLCLDPKIIEQAVQLVHGTRAWIVPWNTNFRLTQEATLALMEKEPGAYRPPPKPVIGDYRGREVGIGLQFGGGCEVVPRAAWELVRGMPEVAFDRGWGSEDIAFSLALDTLWGPHLVPPVNMIHLYHDRPPQDTMNAAAEFAYWEASGRPERMRELVGATGEAPDLPEAVAPRGWYSSAKLNRRPGVVPKHRERYLRSLMVPV